MQIASGEWLYREKSDPTGRITPPASSCTDRKPPGNMAKVFSVEWMSQSIYSAAAEMDREKAQDAGPAFLKPHLPLEAEASSYMDISADPKISLSAEKESDCNRPSQSYNPSSPSSKYQFTMFVYVDIINPLLFPIFFVA